MGLGHAHHGHDHSHDHDPPDADGTTRALTRALVVTALFMAAEAAVGLWSNSLALLSDAGHMLLDTGALALSLGVAWIARRPRSARMSWGYHRAEILGALASGLSIWALVGFLGWEAVRRLDDPPAVHGAAVTTMAFVGLAANLFSLRALHGSQAKSLNVRAAYLHVVTDALGSVGALVAGAVLWITDWRPIDPIITLIFSALMLFSSWKLVREAVNVLMESAPRGVDPARVRAALSRLPGVATVHDLHIWSVSSGRHALSVHLVSSASEGLVARAQALLRAEFAITHTTIQVERPDEFNAADCFDCEATTDS